MYQMQHVVLTCHVNLILIATCYIVVTCHVNVVPNVTCCTKPTCIFIGNLILDVTSYMY